MILDVTDPAEPVEMSVLPDTAGNMSFDACRGVAYVHGFKGKFHVVDFNDPENPVELNDPGPNPIQGQERDPFRVEGLGSKLYFNANANQGGVVYLGGETGVAVVSVGIGTRLKLSARSACQPIVDLSIPGVAESEEETIGGFIGLNDDDDNSNMQPDSEEIGPVDTEDDLKVINLRVDDNVTPSITKGQATLIAGSGLSKTRIWVDANKTAEVELPATYSLTELPQRLFIEGVNSSDALRDEELTLSYSKEEEVFTDKVKLSVMHAEFIDDELDYALEDNKDSDNFFLRRHEDHKDLDIYYRILPGGSKVSNVKINIYDGIDDANLLKALDGEKYDDGSQFKTGKKLHITWTAPINERQDDPGFYRVQLEVFVDGQSDPIIRTSIEDADDNADNGWQSPKDGLGVHDLIWKHRPRLHVHRKEIGIPTSVSRFKSYSELNNSGTQGAFYDLFRDNFNSVGIPVKDYSITWQQILNSSAEPTIYHSANKENAANFVFLQYWMFEMFSTTSIVFGIEPDVFHEGDLEYVQIAVQLSDDARPSEKKAWLKPFGATASQHFYAQTLKWDINDGSGSPFDAHNQEHVEHRDERLVIYVALGSHATYFAADYDIDVAEIGLNVGAFLGTQVQYNSIGVGLVDVTYPDKVIGPYQLVPLNGSELDTFFGRWGYSGLSCEKITDKCGPNGPALRAAKLPHLSGGVLLDDVGLPVNLRFFPKVLHNAARKSDSPQFKKMFIP